MKNFTPELIAKAKTAKTAEELLELAKASNVELTAEEAQTYFTQLNAKGAVADDELDAVAGGGCGRKHTLETLPIGSWAQAINGQSCPKCGATKGIVKSTQAFKSATRTPMGLVCVKCQEWINISPEKDTVVLL